MTQQSVDRSSVSEASPESAPRGIRRESGDLQPKTKRVTAPRSERRQRREKKQPEALRKPQKDRGTEAEGVGAMSAYPARRGGETEKITPIRPIATSHRSLRLPLEPLRPPIAARRYRNRRLVRTPLQLPTNSPTQVRSNRQETKRRGGDRALVRGRDRRTARKSGHGTAPTPSSSRPISPLLYGTRLLILGVGIGALAGTLLSTFDPASRMTTAARTNHHQIQPSGKVATSPLPTRPVALKLSQEITSLKSQVQSYVKQNPKLQAGVFFADLDTGAYLESESNLTFPAASTIKLPIAIAFFEDVDAGKIRLDEQLTLLPGAIASGSGDLQYKKPGTKYSALEVVTKMIAISDNTATNMAIARLGGAKALNRRFASWGLTRTAIHNALPDLEGTNTTSPRELANLMAMVDRGELVSVRSRDRILDIMQQTVNNSMLPKGLGPGATIAHKTGDIGSLVADVGLIDLPAGKRYIAAVMVKRPHNNARAQELIRQISRKAYEYFSDAQSRVSDRKPTVKSPQQ